MSKTVLLINPPIHDFAAYDFFNKPLGLLYLAGVLERAGYHVRLIDALDRCHPALQHLPDLPPTRADGTGKYHSRIIDKPACLGHVPRRFRHYGLDGDTLAELIAHEHQTHRPVAALVTSMMTYWYGAVAQTIGLIRQAAPNLPVGLGGVYARLMPGHAAQHCRPDQLFVEASFGPVLQWLESLKGLPAPYSPEHFTDWPIPAYHLYSRLTYLAVITSLGCPFHCSYCASRLLQPALQQLPPQQFLDQLSRLLDLLDERLAEPANPRQDRHVAFMDDALLAHAPEHIIPILQHIARLNLPLRFHCPNGLHCRFITPQVADLMAACRFGMIRLSYEAAGSTGPLQRAGDFKVSDADFGRAVAHLQRAGFAPGQLEAYLLIGLPHQNLPDLYNSARAVHDMGLQIRLCQYSPIPGTPLFDDACRLYGLDPDEPLLHNKTILAGRDRSLSFEQLQAFQAHTMQLNRAL